MKKNKTQISHNKTLASGIRSLSLLVGFIMLGLLVSCISASSTPTPSSVFYVDGNIGSDANPGSQTQPWRTIQKAANTAKEGDLVKVNAGSYAERVKIKQAGITFESNDATMQGFTISANNVTVKGFYITNTPGTEADGHGFDVSGSNCIIENNHVYYAIRGGINITSSTSGCIVRNNKFERNSQYGIEIHGTNHLVEGNEIWGTIQYHPEWVKPPAWVDADGVRFFGSGHVFRKNYIHDISIDDPQNINPHIDAFQTWDDQRGDVGKNCVFEQNKIILDKTATGFQLEGGTHNLIIRNNIISSFRGLLAYKNGHPPYTSPSDIFVLNNLFIGKLTYLPEENPAGMLISDTVNAVIRNNMIVEQRSQTINTDSTITDSDYNLFYNSDGSTPIGAPFIHDLWKIDPLFINSDVGDFHLQAKSPAIDAGISLESVTRDLDGIQRPQGNGFDIGPYEYLPK